MRFVSVLNRSHFNWVLIIDIYQLHYVIYVIHLKKDSVI